MDSGTWAVIAVMGACFVGGVFIDTCFWALHCRTVRKKVAELEEARRRAMDELLPIAEKSAENLKGYREEVDGLLNAVKQLNRRLNSLTDVVDEIRNGTFTMQWEKKEGEGNG